MFQREKQIVPQNLFQRTAAQCFLLFEQYRLKTHLIGSNVQKEMLQECFESLDIRMTERYSKLFETLQNQINELEKNFMIAKASSLRTLNNIFRNYRRRVGTLSNQPLSNFKYNKFDKNEKMLLASMIYNERDNYSDILQFREQLVTSMQLGKTEIEDRYRQNNKIEDNYKKILQVIDKTQCYTYKYYDNFERSVLTTIHSLQSHFDKLNGYLSVWQNYGSTKAYEIKSTKEKQLEEKNNANENRKYVEDETEQQLQEMINNCPPNSIHRQEYRKRLNQLRRYNNQKQRKLDMVGKMYNKRKGKAGILQGKNKDLNILDWYFTSDCNRVNFSFQDQFRNYNADPDNTNQDYKPTVYQLQKSIKKDKIDQIKQLLQKNQNPSNLNNMWCYDKYGREGAFDLIGCLSQQVQSRIQFQCTKQVELQNTDDRRKRQLLEKQTYYMKQSERREALHIGFLHVHEKTQMDWLLERAFSTEYLPEMFAEEAESSSLQFSDQQQYQESQKNEQSNKREIIFKTINKPVQSKKKTAQEQTVQIKDMSNIEDKRKDQKKQLKKQKELKSILKQTKQTQKIIPKINQQTLLRHQVKQRPQSILQKDLCLEQLITNTYFKQYSYKVIRKQSDPIYKKSKFVYFPSIQQIDWKSVVQFFECQKAFLLTKTSILYFNRVFSAGQEKLKCLVFSLDQNLQQEQLKSKITKCFENMALVTVKFTLIYQELQENNRTSFLIGLLLILLKIGEMQEDYQAKDYIRLGKDIIQDFNCYYYPQEYRSPVSFLVRMQKPSKNQDVQMCKQNQFETTSNKSKSTIAKTIRSQNEANLLQDASNIINKKQQSEIFQQQKIKQQKSLQVVKISQQLFGQHISYPNQRQQNELKRSNSRQYLMTPEDAVILPATNEEQEGQQNQEDDDYDCL